MALNDGKLRNDSDLLLSRRLSRILGKAAVRNPVDLAEGGAGLATLTPKAYASGTAGLTQALSYYTRPDLFQFSGGTPLYAPSMTGFAAWPVTRVSGGNWPSDATKNILGQRFSFLTDAVSLDLILYTTAYRVLIDGVYVSKTVRTDGITSGGHNRLNIATTDTTRKLRRFDIELDRSSFIGGSSNGVLKTIYIGPNDTIVPIDTADKLTIAVYGDSFTEGTAASWQHLGWAPMLGYLLGGVDIDVRQIAIGNTGYVADASAAQTAFLGHISDLSQAAFDLVIMAGGVNDSGLSGVQAAALAFFHSVRTLQPYALVPVLGPWCSYTGPSAGVIAVDAAVSAAVAAWGDPRAMYIPVSPDATYGWITAANGPVINQSGAAGGGSPDNIHPGNVGHEYLARRASAAIRSALRSNGWV